MSITIEAEHWPMAAGCIGLAKLFPEQINYTKSGIVLEQYMLDELAERYINSLVEQFSIADRDYKRLQWYSAQVSKEPENIKKHAAEARKAINEQVKKVKKYYADTMEYEQLENIVDKLKEIKKEDQVEQFFQLVDAYYQLMKTPFINERLTLNYVKAVILNPFFGQTSILQPVFNSKSKQEHIQKVRIDFIEPALLEFHFFHVLKENNYDDIIAFLNEHQEYKPFKDLKKQLKNVNTYAELQKVMRTETLPCSFIDQCMATQSFEEMIFSPLSFSRDKAVNFYWDFDKTIPVPVSAIARVMLFLAPIGMAFYNRRYGSEFANEYLRFAGLIESEKDFEEKVKENLLYQQKRNGGSSFEEAIVGLLQENVDKAKKINQPSYYFIEVYSEYQTKKTLLDYYHMPRYLVKYLSEKGNKLKFIAHKEIRDTFFRSVLNGIDPREVLYDYLRITIQQPFHAKGVHSATMARDEILQIKKGEDDVEKNRKLSWVIYHHGLALKKAMIGRSNDGDEVVYRASGNKKIEGVAYRLLNTAKAKNKTAFMDIIFRTHIAYGLEIPSFFINENIDFDTVATTFLAGLLGENNNEKGENGND